MRLCVRVVSEGDADTVSVLPTPPVGHRFQLDNLFWTTLQEVHAIRRTPEELQLDPTHKTNGRQLPWVFLVGKDSNGETILWGSSILGEGELTLNFAWLLDTALGAVYGASILLAVSLTVTDGDSKIFLPVRAAIELKQLGGVDARCFWHAVTKEYTATVLVGACADEKDAHLPIQRAFNALRKLTESHQEIKDVLAACRRYIKSKQDDKAFSAERWAKALKFIEDLAQLTPRFVYILLGVRIYGGGTTGRNEGENGCFKAIPTVHSNAKLPELFSANKTRIANRLQEREIKSEKYENTLPGGNKNLEERIHIASQLGEVKVVSQAEELLVKRYRLSKEMEVEDISMDVLRFKVREPSRNNSLDKDGTVRLWVRPRRERIVTQVMEGDVSRLVCSCPFTGYWGLPCECALAVTGGSFGLCDVHVRYTMPYVLGRLDHFFFAIGDCKPHPASTNIRGIRLGAFPLPSHPRGTHPNRAACSDVISQHIDEDFFDMYDDSASGGHDGATQHVTLTTSTPIERPYFEFQRCHEKMRAMFLKSHGDPVLEQKCLEVIKLAVQEVEALLGPMSDSDSDSTTARASKTLMALEISGLVSRPAAV